MTSREPLMKPAEVAEYLSIPMTTLAYWRAKGGGPPAVLVGHRLRYRVADVEAWLNEREAS